MDSPTELHFGNASYFIIVDVVQGEIVDWKVTPNPGAELSRKRGITTSNFLLNREVDTLLVGKLGEAPYHILSDRYVRIYKLPTERTVKEAIEAFIDGKIEKLEYPLES